MIYSIFILLACLCTVLAANGPTELHLAFAGAEGMTVSWTTATALQNAPVVVYGSSPSSLSNSTQGTSQTYGSSYFHDVVLTGLASSTTYYYQVQADPKSEASAIKSFVTARAAGDESSYRVLVIGDMGLKNSPNTMASIDKVINETDWIYHIGDIGYADDYYLRGDTYEGSWTKYMTDIESFTSTVPYMVLPGNHECTCTEVTPFICPDNQKNFTAYRNRFRMPWRESGGAENMWWSADVGVVHFVSISTETDFPGSPEGPGTYLGGGPFGDQLAWLQNDLAQANANRGQVPWIIVGGHRPLYSSSTASDCSACVKAFEPLFLKYNVDLVFHGHIHDYERLYSVANGKVMDTTYVNSPAPIYIVNGAAGNVEGHSSAGKASVAAFVDDTHYGYGFLDVINSTTLDWKFFSAADQTLIDQITITKTKR